ncbi:MAG TPA: GTP 3',8-cyclase MoaA [Burkholderiaceae bacterium]|jgi:cyclic pyranopterin phosphate synthase|nr:GTP 3',8-cyclase MoaA [Burkholderiaceae bacterium]
MSERFVPLLDARVRRVALPQPSQIRPALGHLTDRLQRPLRDLRVSVTDRCNFRCTYCMPKEVFNREHPFLPHSQLLSFEEITRLARVFVAHGVEKIRLTGGEPLLRKELTRLVAMLADLSTPDGHGIDLALTTNASLLRRHAAGLVQAGLDRVTVSLDALDDAVFRRMNDVDFPVAAVLDGIDAAAAAGLPVKVNMVVQRGTNEQQIVPMARFFKERGHVLRMIEYMDVGTTNGWRLDQVVPASEIVARIDAEMPLEAIEPNYPGEVARRWRYRDGSGEIGVVASVTQAFCRTCTRARLSIEGQLYLCLFASQGHDLRALLRGSAGDEQLSTAIGQIWNARSDRYSELRGLGQSEGAAKVEMSYIGG